MLIDHLVYAAPDLAVGVAGLEERLGVRSRAGGRHLGLGTHNALLGLGPRTYLEILAPDPGQPAPSEPLPFGADGVTEARLVGWALGCDDIDGAVARARDRGYDPGDVLDMHRVLASGAMLRWRLTSNALTGGPVPFLISWGDTEHPAGASAVGLALESFHLEHPDPSALLPRLAALGVDVEVRQAATPALVARIAGPNGSQVLR